MYWPTWRERVTNLREGDRRRVISWQMEQLIRGRRVLFISELESIQMTNLHSDDQPRPGQLSGLAQLLTRNRCPWEPQLAPHRTGSLKLAEDSFKAHW